MDVLLYVCYGDRLDSSIYLFPTFLYGQFERCNPQLPKLQNSDNAPKALSWNIIMK